MNLLDLRTVFITYVITSLINLTVMGSLWVQHRRRWPGLVFWLADFHMQALGLVLIVLRGHLPDFFTIVLSNVLLIGGTLILLVGLARFYSLNTRLWYNYTYLAAFFFIQLYFLYLHPSLEWRAINVAAGIAITCGQCAWLLLRRVPADHRLEARLTGIVLGLFCLASLLRIALSPFVPQVNDIFKSGLLDTLMVLVSQMLFVGLTFSLILMVNHRLNGILEADIRERKQAENALRDIFESSPTGIFQSTPDGHYLSMNSRLAHVYGYASSAEAIANLTDIPRQLHVDPAAQQEFSRLLNENGQVGDFTERNYRRDGSIIWTATDARVVKGPDGQIHHYEGFVREITDSKKTAQQQEILYQVLRTVSGQLDLQLVLSSAVETIGKYSEYPDASIVLPDEDNTHWVVRGAAGSLAAELGATHPIHGGVIGRAFRTGQLQWVGDALHDPDYLNEVKVTGGPALRSEIAVLLCQENRIFGVLNIESNQPDAFNESDVKTIQSLADIVSLALANALSYQAVQKEIGERAQVEQALRKSESSLQAVLQSTADGILAIGPAGEVLYTNARFVEIWHIPPDVLATRDDARLLQSVNDQLSDPRGFQDKVQNLYKSTTESFDMVEFKDGRVFERLSRPLILAGEHRGRVWSFRDITERRRAEQNLRYAEEKFRTIVEQTNSIAYIVEKGREARVLYISPQIEQVLGYTPEEWVSQPGLWESLLHPEDRERVLAENDRADQSGEPFKAEYRIFTRDGRVIWLYDESKNVLNERGEVLYSQGTERDITGPKQTDKLQEAVYQIATATETTRSQDELYEQIHRIVSSVMPAENFYISLYDEAQDLLHFSYFRDAADEPYVQAIQPGRGLTAYVLRTGRSLLCTQAVHDELERRGEVKLLGVPSAIWLGVPLLVEGKTIGAMVVQHYSDPNAYGVREQTMLEFVSGQVASAIQRKQAEEQLMESEARYRGLFENSPISLWEEDFSALKQHLSQLKQQGVTDLRTYFALHPEVLEQLASEIKVLDVNQASLALMRASVKEQLFGSVKDVMDLDANTNFPDEIISIAEGKSEYQWEGYNATLNGEKISVSLHWSAAPGYEDSLAKVLVSVMDITDRKQAEQQLKDYSERLEEMVDVRTHELRQAQEKMVRQERLAVLGQMAGSVGHELRNPLGVISATIYYLKLIMPEAGEKVRNNLIKIEQEVRTADKIISDLLDFAREKTAQREPIQVAGLVRKTIERFPVPEQLELHLDLPEELPLVFADPLQMQQVLGNLITNACQAISDPKAGSTLRNEKGRLTISSHTSMLGAGQPAVCIQVQDTGVGIPLENMQKLFEPLFTTKARGIGLGLAVSKKLAEANGGRIEVESVSGQGSTFTLSLPVSPEARS